MTNILKQLRQKAGLTQEKLAEEINVAPTTVQNWEKEDKIPPDGFRLLFDYYKFSSRVKNNLVAAFYGDNLFTSMDEILCEEQDEFHLVILDSGNKWRSLLKYVNPEKIGFYSLSNPELFPIYINP